MCMGQWQKQIKIFNLTRLDNMLLKQKICYEISKRLKFGFSLSSQIGLGISILHAHRFKV